MYSVRTNFEVIYHYIESWKDWDLDHNFIEFKQKDNFLIIPKNQVLSIYKK